MSSLSPLMRQSLKRPAFFVCDIQERFRSAIHQFGTVAATSKRMIEFARLFNIPVYVTEQNPKALGSTIPELELSRLGSMHVGTFAKTKFSMYLPEVEKKLKDHAIQSVVIFGIESHVCILQTVLDLLKHDYSVHVIADAVSSCNKEEIPIALARMRDAGAQITTSESIAFQLMGDAAEPKFKEFAAFIKSEKQTTSQGLQDLVGELPKSVL